MRAVASGSVHNVRTTCVPKFWHRRAAILQFLYMVSRCFSCFRADIPIAQYGCEVTLECDSTGTIWLCAECKGFQEHVPCPHCWASVLERACFRCGDALDFSIVLIAVRIAFKADAMGAAPWTNRTSTSKFALWMPLVAVR